MIYKKPEINVLGDATSVIQNTQTKMGSSFDGINKPAVLDPAYDLDE